MKRGSGGFTLLEVLLAVSIGSMLLVAMIAFAFSMGELWGNTSEPRLFEQHVRGVSRFLDNLLRQAEPPPEVTGTFQRAQSGQQQQQQQPQQPGAPQTGAGQPAVAPASSMQAPVAWQRPRGRKYGTEEFLTFELPESPGIFAWPESPLPFVVCALRVDPTEGLFLLWKSRLEVDFEDEAPREFRVSPYVTGIKYYYYDTDAAKPDWEETDQPRSSGGVRDVPSRIQLTFEYHGDEQTVDLVIPGVPTEVPLY
jgi:prepilin-type N-terminal cleavage/methylation domain-containing protein